MSSHPAEKAARKATKRVRSWEESVKQDPVKSEDAKGTNKIPPADLKVKAQAVEEDGALPEEGELPDA